jgi:hypothetical protein
MSIIMHKFNPKIKLKPVSKSVIFGIILTPVVKPAIITKAVPCLNSLFIRYN